MAPLTEDERIDWLRLIRTETIGPVTFARLLDRYGAPAPALDALPRLAARAGRRATLKPVSRAEAAAEIERAREGGARLIVLGEPDYPRLLAQIPAAPPAIYVRGHASLFERPAVAIIGARNSSSLGRRLARLLAEGLGAAGVVVVSGLARGIDGAAHEAALKTGTIAVVAGGADVVYPPEHGDLMAAIAHEGAILSEQPPGAEPTARDFPRRNRLISGLSRGVVVVEAAARSGTLITARFALEQGREVFAVPGSPLDPRCQGANRLIREGATLIESADDILTALAQQSRAAREPSPDGFSWKAEGEPDASETTRIREVVRALLSFTPAHRDDILREADAPPALIIDALIDLVLAGEAEEHPGGRFARRA
ncbi:MAG: DNA-processing protein DprA [Parvularculaceae bacterium]